MRTFLLALALVPFAATGHHGWNAFDTKTELTLQGAVTDFHFVDPHSVIDFDAKDAKGQVRKWEGELTSASNLAAKGWNANSVKAGDQLTISGYPAKSGVPALRVTKVVLGTGQELKMK